MIRVKQCIEEMQKRFTHRRVEEAIADIRWNGQKHEQERGNDQCNRDRPVLNARILNCTGATQSNQMIDHSTVQNSHDDEWNTIVETQIDIIP